MTADISPDERGEFVESAMSAIADGAPSDWVSLHAEFALAEASATVTTESSAEAVPLAVPPEALQDIASHQRRCAELGEPWHRLIVDSDRAGDISVQMVSAGASTLRRVVWALWGLAAVLALAAGAVFAFGRPEAPPPPPRAEPVPVAAPSPREQQALKVITEWFDAASRGDAAGMRRLGCPALGPYMGGWVDTIRAYGADQIAYVDGIVGFTERGQTATATAVFRLHPLSDKVKQVVKDNESKGGFFYNDFVLTGSGDAMKVCGP